MKKVLFCVGRLSNGGAERVVSLWASLLARRGYDVTVYVAYRSENEYEVDPRVKIASVTMSQNDFLSLSKIGRLKKQRHIIKELNPDVMINFLPKIQMKMLFLSFGIRCRKIETVRNNSWVDSDIGNLRFIWNLCFKRADAIIVQTQEQIEYFASKEKKKCTVIHNPLAEVYKYGDSHIYKNKVKRFVYCGRLTPQKNLSMLISAFSKSALANEDIILDIYGMGDSEYVAYLKDLIERSKMTERIFLKGFVNDTYVALMQHDCFVLSSDYEGMPNALAEAMATGMVCISTDCRTGPRDMIENGKTGYLVKTGDIDSMAEAIEKVVVMSNDQCDEMGRLARRNILELCDDEVNIRKLIEVIEG